MRLAAARAIRNATLAQARVFDSAIDPIDHRISEERKPLIIVTTDDDTGKPTGRDLNDFEREIALVIEIAVASRVIAQEGDDAVAELVIPHTDEGMELSLDIIEHQVIRALFYERSDWSRAFMRLVPRVTNYISRRGASTENGIRFAARQIVLSCDVIATPVAGAPLVDYWQEIVETMEADPETTSVGALIRSQLETPLVEQWRRQANAIGLTEDEAAAIGIAPVWIYPAVPPEAADEIEIDFANGPNVVLSADEAMRLLRLPLARITGSSAINATASKV
jgi:hypothetical protein